MDEDETSTRITMFCIISAKVDVVAATQEATLGVVDEVWRWGLY